MPSVRHGLILSTPFMAGRISAAVGQLSTGIISGVELSGGNSHAPRLSSPSPPLPLMTQPVVGRWDGKKSPHIAFASVTPAPLGGDTRGRNLSPRGAHPIAPDRKKENIRVKAGGWVPRDGSPSNSGAFQKAAPVSWTPSAQPSPPLLNDTFSFPALGSPGGSVGSSLGSSSTYSTPGSSPAGSPLLGARWGGPKERKRYESAGLARYEASQSLLTSFPALLAFQLLLCGRLRATKPAKCSALFKEFEITHNDSA